MKPTVLDVASFFLSKKEDVEVKKVQHLAYYAQAWHISMFGDTLFDETFVAQKQGPISSVLDTHFSSLPTFEASLFSQNQLDMLQLVFETYEHFSLSFLQELMKEEVPYQVAQADCQIIETELMLDMYGFYKTRIS